MKWKLSRDKLRPRQRIRWDGNEYKVARVDFCGAEIKCIKGPLQGRQCLPISSRSEVERASR